MTASTLTPAPGAVDAAANNHSTSLARRFAKDPIGMAALIFLSVVALACALAPLITTNSPEHAVLGNVLADPGNGLLLGGDSAGRDVFSRLLHGGQFSLLGALLALSIAVVLGGVTGLIAGYFGTWFDTLSSAAAAILMALPGMVVLLAARSVLGSSAWWAMSIFGVLLSASVFRLVRQTVQNVRNELYVDAARVAGLSDARIIFRHVLRVVRAPFIIQAASIGSVAIAIQAGLEFLGLGDMNLPTWGSMLNDGFARIYQQPLLVIWPAVMIALVCLSLTLIANSVRDALEGGGSRRRARTRRAQRTTRDNTPPTAALQPSATQASAPHSDTNPTNPPNDAPLLTVNNLQVGYHQADGTTTQIVHGINLTVQAGEVLGLIGESGSGKTQTAFSIMRLLPAGGAITGGEVLWNGRNLAELSERELTALRGKEIAYIPQEPMSNLDPSFTIGSQLVEPMRIHLGLNRAEAKTRALDLLTRVGIVNPERVYASYPHQVSGGMAQRVLIAGAISCNPRLLIADEPTTALDVTVQAEILDLLRSIQQEHGMGVIMVTHNFGVVADICDRVAVMCNGEIVETGPAETIFSEHTHPYTTQLFNAILTPDNIREPYRAPHTLKGEVTTP